MELDQYTNFNRSTNVKVKPLVANHSEIGALCRYERESNDVFLLPEATVTYVVKGEKRLFSDSINYLMKAGDLLYLPKYSVVHSEITTRSFESINVCIPTWLTDQPGSETVLRNEVLFFRQQLDIKQLFNSLYPIFNKEEQQPEILAKGLQQLLALCRSEHLEDSRVQQIHQADSDQIIRMVREHIYKPMTSSEMAVICHMSLASYKRKFERIFSESPKTWIRKRKLEQALFRLQTKKGTVADTCLQVGFENNAHFSHQFKKQFGCRPSDLLKGMKMSQNR